MKKILSIALLLSILGSTQLSLWGQQQPACSKRKLCVNMINETLFPIKIRTRYENGNLSNEFTINPGQNSDGTIGRFAVGDSPIKTIETIVVTKNIRPLWSTSDWRDPDENKEVEIRLDNATLSPSAGKGTLVLRGPSFGPNPNDQLFKYNEYIKAVAQNPSVPLNTPSFWDKSELLKIKGREASGGLTYTYKAGMETNGKQTFKWYHIAQ